MDQTIHFKSLICEFGAFTVVTIGGTVGAVASSSLPGSASGPGGAAEALIAASRELRGPMRLTECLDISGSMEQNMRHLSAAALASVDLLKDGDSLRVLVFDHDANEILPRTTVTAGNREAIKSSLKGSLNNRNGSTNLEIPLIMALQVRASRRASRRASSCLWFLRHNTIYLLTAAAHITIAAYRRRALSNKCCS